MVESVQDLHRSPWFNRLAIVPIPLVLGWAGRYGLAAGSVAAAMGLRLAAEAWFGPGLPTYVTFYPAIMVVALLAGFGPGLLATALAGLTAAYWILPPVGQFVIASPVDRLGLVIFIGMGLFISTVAELYRRNRDKAAAYDREAALRESQERLAKEWEQTFNTVPDAIAILDRQHRIVRVNRAMGERLAVKPEDCVGLPCYGCVHGMDAPPAFCPHALLLADGKEHTAEVREERLGGDFLVTTTPLRDAEGGVIGSVHVARDITDYKKAEEKPAPDGGGVGPLQQGPGAVRLRGLARPAGTAADGRRLPGTAQGALPGAARRQGRQVHRLRRGRGRADVHVDPRPAWPIRG